MASLVLGAVGTAIGGSIGGSILGVSLASIGGMVGSTVGRVVDNLILSSLTPAQRVEGPRLQEMSVMTSSEGSAQGRLHGLMRVPGNLIWATRFKETKDVDTERVGGKGGGQKVETTSYSYSVSMAVAFGEGNERTQLGRVWVDGKEMNLAKTDFEFYSGAMDQLPDSTIQSIEGIENTPAFRGTAYLVFTDLDLTDYGNRIPQITAEIIRPLITTDPDDISNAGRSFCLIPGSGEFAYGTDKYTLQTSTASVTNTFFEGGTFENALGTLIGAPSVADGDITAIDMNAHNNRGDTDFVRSMEQLEIFQPNLDAITLVVGWFGNDLRIGECEVKPLVEFSDRGGIVTPREWNVDGLNRQGPGIDQVSRDTDGNPVYGGTPSDDVVVEAIKWLKARGHRVVFYPFLFMDVPAINTLPDPYSDNAATSGQPAFPWRGRITCSPAAGQIGTVDKTAAAAAQVDTFFTREWGINRMIEHYANLCANAGGVDGFVIGTEMPGMTTIRSDATTYPAVGHLKTLAASVKSIVGASCDVGYAADWSEYHSHRPADGSNDVFFPLDDLWSDTNIDFIGIDNYLPVADWRDGTDHLDYDADNGVVSPHNISYLQANIEGGEMFDWYYASDADRESQTRTPITDGTYSKPWVFRQKDIRNWWQNAHYARPGGVESASATSYVAGSKPIWFTEFGCPSVDKGAYQPNVFHDPKSSESAFPHFSNGETDEFMPRVYAEATLAYWRDNSPPGMVTPENMFIWCWDARPYPDYPHRTDVWSDGQLWDYGHWMTGRLAYPSLPRLVTSLCAEVGITDIDVSQLNGAQALVRGYYVDNVMAIRDMIGSLMTGFQFDAFESQGLIKFALKSSTALVPLQLDDLVSTDNDPVGLSVVRTQPTELPKTVQVDFIDAATDYAPSSLDAKRHSVDSQEVAQLTLPMVLPANYVRALGDSMVHQAWAARENGALKVPPSHYKLDPGDGVSFPLGQRTAQARIQAIDTGSAREVTFKGFDLSLYDLPAYPVRPRSSSYASIAGYPALYVLDIPLLTGEEPSHWSPRLATWARPWPGAVAVYQNVADAGEVPEWALGQTMVTENTLGKLAADVPSDRTGVWLPNATIQVRLFSGGTLGDASKNQVLKGANACAIQNDAGSWEVFQYQNATLNGDGTYTLSNLIRGQLGTEWVMNESMFSAGNAFALIENQFATVAASAYLPLGQGDRDATIDLRFGSASKSVEDSEAYIETVFTHTAAAQKPYSPAHLKARWNLGVNNDISLTWIRRSRFNADSWDVSTVPLNEETEKYTIEVLDGAAVVREVTDLASPAYTYTEAMQIADFGAVQTSSLKFRVYQMSANVGRGVPAEETITR